MKKLRLAQTMMIATICLIVAFQVYYVTRLYKSEWNDLKKETDVLFREAVYKLQVARFKKDTTFYRKFSTENMFNVQAVNVIRNTKERKKGLQKKDTLKPAKSVVITMPAEGTMFRGMPEVIRMKMDSLAKVNPGRFKIITSENGERVRMFSQIFKDSIKQFDSLFTRRILKEGVNHEIRLLPHERTGALESHTPVKVRLQKPGTEIRHRVSGRNADYTKDPDVKIFVESTVANDSLPLPQLDSIYKKDLKKSAINLPFSISKDSGTKATLAPSKNELKTNLASVGFINPYHYRASFENPFYFLLEKIAPNILLSFLLVAFTILSFVVLYRNLMSQRRLADIKNDFISNITHELKTPIATVNVAIEALRSFNVLNDTTRTQEYLDISSSELQRLSLLVDKVLKLSMFEKKEISLKKEWFNLEQLVSEVMNSMRLQFDKYKSQVSLNVYGDKLDVKADRLHITSVVYNLLDNALKYSKDQPKIDIDIMSHEQHIELKISDNGIGVGKEYQSKIFEQFFRVPSGDRHNIKGYGLGLSYVSHIVKTHHGFIEVQSELEKGSTFTIKLPYDEADVIRFDKNRSVRKEF